MGKIAIRTSLTRWLCRELEDGWTEGIETEVDKAQAIDRQIALALSTRKFQVVPETSSTLPLCEARFYLIVGGEQILVAKRYHHELKIAPQSGAEMTRQRLRLLGRAKRFTTYRPLTDRGF